MSYDSYMQSLSREVSYVLRHHPEEYGLELDSDGFVKIEDLLNALNTIRQRPELITEDTLQYIMEHSDKKRLEVDGIYIRALYGHSAHIAVEKVAVRPPDVLYHGTTRSVVDKILREGLKPMSRKFVHFSVDTDTAYNVASRRDDVPMLLVVDAAGAYEAGYSFYEGNREVFLADEVPPEFLHIEDWA